MLTLLHLLSLIRSVRKRGRERGVGWEWTVWWTWPK